MEQILKHIKENFLNKQIADIHKEIEQSAEVYVSSVLGLSDEDEQKEIIKTQYIDACIEELRFRL